MSAAVFRRVMMCLLVGFGTGVSWGQETPSPQPLEWNVFLSNWQVLGPFPKPDKTKGGTDVKFVENEAELRPGALVVYDKKFYQWRPWGKAVVQFRNAFHTYGASGDHMVAYAWTEFLCPQAQKAVLALGHDDSIAAWLNGQEVHRNDTAWTACFLDHAAVEVDLKAGVNTLLLKVGQGRQGWEAVARLRPAGIDKPLFSLGCERPVSGDLGRLPVVHFDILGTGGRVLTTISTSGFRNQSPQGLRFLCYAPPLPSPPPSVRVRYAAVGLRPFERTYSWEEISQVAARIPLEADKPIAGRVVDAKTGEPIAGATFWNAGAPEPIATDVDGGFQLDNITPLATHRWVAVAGYQARHAWLAWPRSDKQVIKLDRGGQVLRGRVVSQDGKPLANVKIDPRVSGGFSPQVLTDDEGRFEIAGIPEDETRLFPVVTCAGFVAKDRFGLDLEPDRVTEVEWKLTAGGVVTGRVTAKQDGAPIAGVTITSGFDRFGSNIENPSTKTDADGRFLLNGVEPGQTIIHAFSENYAPTMHNVSASPGEPVEVNFELEPGQPAAGRVVDPQGKPIHDVWLVTDTWNGARMFRRETRTDADGRFRLEHMPATAAEVHVLKNGYVSKRDLMVKGGEKYDVTLLPVIEHTVRVRLADRAEPVPDITIHKGYQWSGREDIHWQTDSYESQRNYDKVAGVFTVRTSEAYDAGISFRFRYPGYRDVIITAPKDATEPQSYEATLEKVPALAGRVVSADTGKPLAGVSVALVSKEDRLRVDHWVQFKHPAAGLTEFTGVHVVTGSDGSFELPRPEDPQAMDLVLTQANNGFLYLSRLADWLGDEPVQLAYPEGGTIEGTVTIAGEPASGEVVHVQWMNSDGTESWDGPFGVGGQVTADPNGRYRFVGLGPGRYRISRVRGFDSPTGGSISMYLQGEEVVLLPGKTLVHDIDQPAGHTLTGQTLDPRGMPLGDCVVTVSRTNLESGVPERLDVVRADRHGRFAFRHLPEGSFELSADHYSVTDGQRCGLGGQDYRGREQVRVPADAPITITLQSSLGDGLSNQGSLVGLVPPDFAARPLDSDKTFTLSEQWGKVVAIDFWATWCGPCMAVMPQMKALHEKHKDRDDVVFITVSLDQDEEQLRAILKEKGLEFPVLFSGQGWNDPIARSFGVTGIPSSFVIGRDGRFASENVHGANLTAAVEEALNKPIDPLYSSGKKPARLTVKIQLEGGDTGAPGVKLTLQAVNAQGQTVREDVLALTGLANQIVWQYPQVEKGGRVVAVARGEGLAEQRKTLDAPSASEELLFSFACPRSVSGRVMADGGRTPAAGVKVLLQGANGFQRSAVSQEDGGFRIATLPGQYVIGVEGTAQFAPLSSKTSHVAVPVDADPAPVAVEVCRAVTVTGAVFDAEGNPVAGAKVQTGSALGATTDEKGKFQLSGVPSVGKATIYASKDNVYGAVHLTDADGRTPQHIVLGEGLTTTSRGLSIGADAPPLAITTLDGKPIEWRPHGDRDSLLVFCALGHPAGRKVLAQAHAWAQENKTLLTALSIDWCAAQAQRELKALGLDVPVLFAGPGGLEVAKTWAAAPPAKAYLVSPQGTILTTPAALREP